MKTPKHKEVLLERRRVATSARLSVQLAAVALLLAASVAALLVTDRLTGLFVGPVFRRPALTPESQRPIQDSGI